MSTEKEVEDHIVEEVKALGGIALKLEVRSRRGWPDRLCILPHGLTVYIEVKKEGGVLSRLQAQRLKFLADLGHLVLIVEGMEEADDALTSIQRVLKGRANARARDGRK